jgi:gluconokinase
MIGFVVLVGVAGSGKTTVGRALAGRLGWDFVDADDLHPQANIDKMAHGIPLGDADRLPWLEAVNEVLRARAALGRTTVLACSALKEDYRRILVASIPEVVIVYLKVGYELGLQRLKTRAGHYMPAELLESQFAALEEPRQALAVDAALSVGQIVDAIVAFLSTLKQAEAPPGDVFSTSLGSE